MSTATPTERLWPGAGLAFVGLFLGGLLFADVLAGRPYPGIDEPVGQISDYFGANGAEVRALSFFHALAAVALVIFVAYVRAFLGRVEGNAGGLSTLAFGGGLMAASFLLLSALLFWALARPVTAGESAVARALFDLSFLAGGVALLGSLGLFIGATSLVALRTRALRAWIGWMGIVTAVISLLSVATMLSEAGALGPGGIIALAALPAILWISLTSFVLVRAARAEPPGEVRSELGRGRVAAGSFRSR